MKLIDDLKAAAKAATKGPYTEENKWKETNPILTGEKDVTGRGYFHPLVSSCGCCDGVEVRDEDKAYLLQLSPEKILLLCEAVEALEAGHTLRDDDLAIYRRQCAVLDKLRSYSP